MALNRILVFQTAFIGDVVLTLPVVQNIRRAFPRSDIAFVSIPAAAGILENHPAINRIISYDKRGEEAGTSAALKLAGRLRRDHFDAAVIPHRSFRSATIGWLARIPRRVGFSTSAAPWLFTDIVKYDKSCHEIERNLSLLQPLGIAVATNELPVLFPSDEDKRVVDRLLFLHEAGNPKSRQRTFVAVAPGSVWNTKRWLKEHFIQLGKMLVADGFSLMLVGSRDDAELCAQIARFIANSNVLNAAGKLSLLQSAELIRRCSVLVSNDSAPMHLAVGVRTPVVGIFGATVPQFGFAPRGPHDVVVETNGLSCRPCSIHGGDECPIETFVCMKDLKPEMVYSRVQTVVQSAKTEQS